VVSFEVPAVSVSAGVDAVGRYTATVWRAPAFLVSAEVRVARFVVIQGTAAEWTWHRPRHILFASPDEHWRTFCLGTNIVLRGARGPVAATIGTGVGFQHSTLLESTCTFGCQTLAADRQFASHAVRVSPSIQFTGGADLRIAPALIVFGELLMVVGNEGALGTFSGVRVPMGSRTCRRQLPAAGIDVAMRW
jgi:hypothetical protein